jgi:hypothetical protein
MQYNHGMTLVSYGRLRWVQADDHLRSFAICAFSIVLLIGAPNRARADPFVVDQVALPVAGVGSGFGDVWGDIAQAQTFTVGITGTLAAVDLFILRWSSDGRDPLVVELRSTSNGTPVESDDVTLARLEVPAANVTPYPGAGLRLDLSQFGVGVATGQVLAFVLQSPGATMQFSWLASSGDYPAGAAFVRSPSFGLPAFSPVDPSAFNDFAFRTFVDPAPVPEPASMLLVGTVLAGAGLRRWRHKRGN